MQPKKSEPSIFRGIAFSLERPVIGSNFEIELRMQTNCPRIQMIVHSSTIFILKIRLSQSSSSSCIIRKPQYKWYVYTILLIAHFLFFLRPLFSLEAAVSVFASTPSTSMSFNDSQTVPQVSKFGISSPNGSSEFIPV